MNTLFHVINKERSEETEEKFKYETSSLHGDLSRVLRVNFYVFVGQIASPSDGGTRTISY